MDLRVVPAREEWALYIGLHLRDQDFHELFGANGGSPWESVMDSFYSSAKCYCVLTREWEPIAIFGVAEGADYGIPWMVGTDKLKEHRRDFIRGCLHWIKYLQKDYDVLMNFVDKRNTVSRRWLRAMGFVFIKDVPYGPFGLPYTLFMRLKDV